MSTDVLTLMQWLSPGFPVGAFAYSHGLEQVIETGQITCAETLRPWLEDILTEGGGQADLVLLARAYRGGLDNETDAVARAFAASTERHTETLDQGMAFAQTIEAIWHLGLPPATYPVAVGQAAAARGIPLDLTAETYAHAFTANLVSAAVRLIPVGQTDGQKLLADLKPLIQSTAGRACAEDAPLYSNCIASDIAAMRHETQYSKVFRT